MSSKWYFNHIPKTGGTSLLGFVRASLDQRLICPAGLWDHLISIPLSALKQYQVFIGHFGADLDTYLDDDTRKITFLRDPVQRTCSHYHHIRRSVEHPDHENCIGLSIEDFSRSREMQHNVLNYQARYITPRGFDPTRIRALGGPFSIQTAFELTGVDTWSDTNLTKRAVAALQGYTLVGNTANFRTAVEELATIFGVPMPKVDLHQNSNPGKSTDAYDVSNSARAVIEDRTAVDRALYDRWCPTHSED